MNRVLEQVNVVQALEPRHTMPADRPVFRYKVGFPLRSFYLLGTRVDNIDGDLARRIVTYYVERPEPASARKIFFTNAHSICTAQRNKLLRLSINAADLVLPDGSGVKIGGLVTGNRILENLNGTDFTPQILSIAEKKGWSVYLLGGAAAVIKKCVRQVRAAYPRLHIAGFHQGYFRPGDKEEIIRGINEAQPDILLVALGTPLQELWLTSYAYRLNVKVCLAVGGLFDFLSLSRKRAPQWMRSLGIEWLFRFVQDPSTKWNRVFLEIPMFLFLLFARQIVSARPERYFRHADNP
ncbi:MAG TPA: WecB/TagA/CpsF family glycosyltransferase [Bacteroidota bacterium]|nr:WecB/TagA/CpsF family glycosyltransferase [Bacteroidota bacterium]